MDTPERIDLTIMKLITTLCIGIHAVCQTALACSWIPVPFCETSNARPSDAVISGRIINVDMDGIDLEVIDVLRGEEDREIIRIWDGTDWDCNGLFSMAAADLGSVDDSIIVVLPLIDTIENTWDVLGDYRRPDYYEHQTELRITNGVVHGAITGFSSSIIDEMLYPELVALWAGGSGICSELSIAHADEEPVFAAYVANNWLEVSTRNHIAGSTIRIYAMNGQEMVAVRASPGTTRIDLSGIAAGMYQIIFDQNDGTRASARVFKF